MKPGLETRKIIHQILKLIKLKSLNIDHAYIRSVNSSDLSESDKNFIFNVVLNSMRNFIFTNNIIIKFTKVDQKSDSYFLLLSAITQIFVLNIKDFAVTDATVELSKSRLLKSSPKFINGVLRNIIRNKKNIVKIKDHYKHLPKWYKKMKILNKDYIKSDFINTIKKKPGLHIVFKNKYYCDNFKEKGYKTTDNSIYIEKTLKVEKIENYKKGEWWIQDLASMLPLYLSDNFINKKIADICAAPGGKTFQALSKGGIIKAYEINQKKINLMNLNLKRLKYDCEVNKLDITNSNIKEKFDIVILDAPCSAIGTIRKNPEIFFRNKGPNFKKIRSVQEKLLNKSKNILKKNGIIIYMVCSFFEEECEKQIYDFLKKNKNFSILKYAHNNERFAKKFINKSGFFSTIPSSINKNIFIDGFFSAKLIKND